MDSKKVVFVLIPIIVVFLVFSDIIDNANKKIYTLLSGDSILKNSPSTNIHTTNSSSTATSSSSHVHHRDDPDLINHLHLCPASHHLSNMHLRNEYNNAANWISITLNTTKIDGYKWSDSMIDDHPRVVQWLVQEVDIDVENGEFHIPVVQLLYHGDHYYVELMNDYTRYYLQALIDQQRIQCQFHYHHHQLYTHHHSTSIPRLLHARPVNGFSFPMLICPFSPTRIIHSFSLYINQSFTTVDDDDNDDEENDDDNSDDIQTVNLPLCYSKRRRVYIEAFMKPVWGTYSIDGMLKYIQYHIKLGVDHFTIFDRDNHILDNDKERVLQTYIDNKMLDIVFWPLNKVKKGVDEITGLTIYYDSNEAECDQHAALFAHYLLYRRLATWILPTDYDEYLVLPFQDLKAASLNSTIPSSSKSTYMSTTNIQSLSFSSRSCLNSYRCPSLLRSFLSRYLEYGTIQFKTWIFHNLNETDDKRMYDKYASDDDKKRISDPNLLYVQKYVTKLYTYSRSVGKFIYQVLYSSGVTTHGSYSIPDRPPYITTPEKDDVYIAHYKDLDGVRIHIYYQNQTELFWGSALHDTSVADLTFVLPEATRRFCETCTLVP